LIARKHTHSPVLRKTACRPSTPNSLSVSSETWLPFGWAFGTPSALETLNIAYPRSHGRVLLGAVQESPIYIKFIATNIMGFKSIHKLEARCEAMEKEAKRMTKH
jgi:hypothetical protein